MDEGVDKDLGQPKDECDPTVLYMKSSRFVFTNFRFKIK